VPMSVGEILYLCLVIAVVWWAYSELKQFF
jgi:hypothetical protein